MFTRAAALLVLFAAFLQAAPQASNTVQAPIPSAAVSIRAERMQQQKMPLRIRLAAPPTARVAIAQSPAPSYPGYATPHQQRPPPALR